LTVDERGNPIPVHTIQIRLARIVIGVLVLTFIALQFFGSPTVDSVTKGGATVYTSKSSFGLFSILLPALTGIIAFVYALQPGIFRLFATILITIAAWLAYTAFNMDTSNHNVTVTSTSVAREVGTKSDPIRHEIDFTTTAYLYIDEILGTRGPNYELVANAATDGNETRIPIFDMMRTALPQIIENASNNNVVIGDSVDGSAIPAAVRVDAGK